MKQQIKINIEMDENGKIDSEIIIQASIPLIASVILTVVKHLKDQSEEAAKELMKRVFTTYMAENLEDLMNDEEKEDEKAVTNKIIAKI